ncbi:methylamine utilization protein [Nocardia sp. NPDC051750]|uniref:methylamine utilization protein n=1 Tax=Nocardia sp. NPDC051750 TaxID=3364325 RepID=UPI0037899F80
MTTLLDHEALPVDMPQIRPELRRSVGIGSRLALPAIAAGAGIVAALVAAPGAAAGLTGAVVGAGLITALAANWSTCGMSVAGVVVAPKQPDRRGSSTPLRRLGWHALGSTATASITGALIGALGGLALGLVPITLVLGAWAVLAAAYGLHELGLLVMPTPMRRRQLPRHLRRSTAPWKVSLLFGAIIGPGFLIYIRSSAYYLLALGVAAVGSPALGAALFVTVALGRCLPSATAIVYTRRGGSMPGFLSLMCLVDRRVQVFTGAVLVGLGAFALGVLV